MVYFTMRGPICETTDRHGTGGSSREQAGGVLPGPKIDINNDPERAQKVLRASVAAILRTPIVRRVNFSIENNSINKQLMEKVAKALENDLIDVKLAPAGKKFSAFYSSLAHSRITPGQKRKFGKITISENSFCTGVGRAGIFHECVHALNDVCSYNLSEHPDEVFAYLADGLYMMAGKITMPRSGPGAPLHAAAYTIIRDKNMLSKPRKRIKWSDCDGLMDAVKRVYKNKGHH